MNKNQIKKAILDGVVVHGDDGCAYSMENSLDEIPSLETLLINIVGDNDVPTDKAIVYLVEAVEDAVDSVVDQCWDTYQK